MLQLALWLLAGAILLWLLMNYVDQVIGALWEILMPIVDSKPIDLQTKFGEWAGNRRRNTLARLSFPSPLSFP